jgi:hypothetical protein
MRPLRSPSVSKQRSNLPIWLLRYFCVGGRRDDPPISFADIAITRSDIERIASGEALS